LESGQGVKPDLAAAVKWYRRAAEQKEPKAAYALGLCYADGDGVSQDWIEAYKWIAIAGAQGQANAVAFLPVLEKKLTPEQKARALELAKAVLLPEPSPTAAK
jgi:TPR repeat protein